MVPNAENCREVTAKTYAVFHDELKQCIEREIRQVTNATHILLRNSDRGQNVKIIQGHFFRCP
jgi:hypothetical protein